MHGCTLCLVAIRVTNSIGDGRVLPVANQSWVSTTQKSGSECVTIARVSVMITFSSDVKLVPFAVRCFCNFSSFA